MAAATFTPGRVIHAQSRCDVLRTGCRGRLARLARADSSFHPTALGALEGPDELCQVAGWGLDAAAVALRPRGPWEVERPEQPVDEWELSRVVLVDGIGMVGVMPMVKLGRGNEPGQ